MLTGLFGLAVAFALLFPSTPTGRWLHRHMVELPLRLASKLERKHVLLALILLFGGQALLFAAPLDLALLYALDLSLYLDAVLAVYAIGATARLSGVVTTLKALGGRLAFRARPVKGQPTRPRARRSGPTSPRADHDGEERGEIRPRQRGLTNFSVMRSLSPMAA